MGDADARISGAKGGGLVCLMSYLFCFSVSIKLWFDHIHLNFPIPKLEAQ